MKKMNQGSLDPGVTKVTTMFSYLRLWWKVRKLKKSLIRQVEIEKLDAKKYVAKCPSFWKKNGNVIWQ